MWASSHGKALVMCISLGCIAACGGGCIPPPRGGVRPPLTPSPRGMLHMMLAMRPARQGGSGLEGGMELHLRGGFGSEMVGSNFTLLPTRLRSSHTILIVVPSIDRARLRCVVGDENRHTCRIDRALDTPAECRESTHLQNATPLQLSLARSFSFCFSFSISTSIHPHSLHLPPPPTPP